MPSAGVAGFAQGLAGGLKTGIDLGMEVDRRKKQDAKDAEAKQRQDRLDSEAKTNRERDDAVRLGQLGIQQAQETRLAKSAADSDLEQKRQRLQKAQIGMMYEGLNGPEGLQSMLQFNQDMQRDLGLPEDRHWENAEMRVAPGKTIGDIVVTRKDGKKEIYSGEMIVRDMVKAGNMRPEWAEWKIFGTIDDHQYLEAITPEFEAVRKQYDSLNRALSAIPEKERKSNPRAAALEEQISKLAPQYDHLWSQVKGAHEGIRKKTRSYQTGGIDDGGEPPPPSQEPPPSTKQPQAGFGIVEGVNGPVTPPDDAKAKQYSDLLAEFEKRAGRKATASDKDMLKKKLNLL